MDRQEALCAAVAERRDDMTALAAEMIRIPTLNPPGQFYRDACEHLAARLAASGFETRLMRAQGAPGDSDRWPRWNLVARREGRRPGPCVHFNGHIDVVEVGRGWTVDPFAGVVRDGRLYGRGACDMKGGLAAAVVAAEAFVAVRPDFPGAVEISATADEESGGYGGVAWLAERGFFSPARVQHVIIPEPLNKDRVCLGHRGVWWAEIETEGRIAHGSMPFLGDCAVRHMGAVLAEMERSLWPALAERLTAAPVVPDGARRPTLNVNAIHGGEPEQEAGYSGLPAPNVPHRCRMVIDRRFIAEERLEAVKDEMRALLDRVAAGRPGFRYAVRDLFEVQPSLTPEDAPVTQAVSRAVERVLGRAPTFVVSPGTYDQKHIDRIGKLRDCVAYGPGVLDLAHQPDEYIDLDDMAESAAVMALALDDLLGD
ncbi:MAG: acetylornithine deacetylase/succinyl-diaminopimelate desuccinylase family protein [Rhodobacteraceae bacterium]|nr:MAG: acetylornithine deacetylase/succinyl-diaminopimelate desuccinylase family protein [Paracoccaceae bacterium]